MRPCLSCLGPIACAIALLAVPAQAPGQPERTVGLLVPAAVCRALVTHQPAPDVAYRPGVDALGRPVAPADLPGSASFRFSDTFVINLTLDLAERFGIAGAPELFDAEAYLGTVLVRGNRVFFNGQPITSEGEAALAQACRQRRR